MPWEEWEREREDAPGFTSPPLCFLGFRATTRMGVTQMTFLESLLKHQAHLPAETRIPGVLCPVLSIHSASHPLSKPAAPTLFAITKLRRRQQGAAAMSCYIPDLVLDHPCIHFISSCSLQACLEIKLCWQHLVWARAWSGSETSSRNSPVFLLC